MAAGETSGWLFAVPVKVLQSPKPLREYDMGKICDRIRYEACLEQVSYGEIARSTGISKDCILDYVSPRYAETSMNVATLKKIAEYFHKDAYYFCNSYHIFLDRTDGAEFLKEARRRTGMSQRDFAQNAGVSLYAYKAYESGQAKVSEKVWRFAAGIMKGEG